MSNHRHRMGAFTPLLSVHRRNRCPPAAIGMRGKTCSAHVRPPASCEDAGVVPAVAVRPQVPERCRGRSSRPPRKGDRAHARLRFEFRGGALTPCPECAHTRGEDGGPSRASAFGTRAAGAPTFAALMIRELVLPDGWAESNPARRQLAIIPHRLDQAVTPPLGRARRDQSRASLRSQLDLAAVLL